MRNLIKAIIAVSCILKFASVSQPGVIYEQNVQEDDVELLAHLIYGESGSDRCSDTLQLYVGSVVLNRVDSDTFPDNLHDVIYQSGQYGCVSDGNFNKTPNERAYKHARLLLTEGSYLPKYVVFQMQTTGGHPTYVQEQNMYFGVEGR